MKEIKWKYKHVLTSIFIFFAISKVVSAQDFGAFSKVEAGINGIELALEMPVW